jgi:hypothetical protein
MKKATYTPFKGGSGPSTEQSDENTQALFQFARTEGIVCKLKKSDPILYSQTGEKQKAVQVWDSNFLCMWVSYDRWGFCASCETDFLDDKDDINDQMNLETAVLLMKQFSIS